MMTCRADTGNLEIKHFVVLLSVLWFLSLGCDMFLACLSCNCHVNVICVSCQCHVLSFWFTVSGHSLVMFCHFLVILFCCGVGCFLREQLLGMKACVMFHIKLGGWLLTGIFYLVKAGLLVTFWTRPEKRVTLLALLAT